MFSILDLATWPEVCTAFSYPQQDRVYKKCEQRPYFYIVEFIIPTEADTNEERENIVNPYYAKFRASQLYCTRILNISTMKWVERIVHCFHHVDGTETQIEYISSSMIYPDSWDKDKTIVCGHGLHFFNSLETAFIYGSYFAIQDNGECHEYVRDLLVKWLKLTYVKPRK